MIHAGSRVARGSDGMRRVAIRTGCRLQIPGGHRAAVHARLIALHRMRNESVPRQKRHVRVARAAGGRLILFGYRRQRVFRRENLVHRPVARRARGALLIAAAHRHAVRAGEKFGSLRRVAGAAQLRRNRCRPTNIMRHPMATGAACVAQHRVHAAGNFLRLLRVASGTLRVANMFGMREASDIAVALGAAQLGMGSALMGCLIYIDAFACRRLQVFLTVAQQAFTVRPFTVTVRGAAVCARTSGAQVAAARTDSAQESSPLPTQSRKATKRRLSLME